MDFVTILVPCRDEADYIEPCLSSIIAGDYPHERMEVLVIDGMSQDRTREIVGQYSARYPFVRLLDNERQITPCGLNVGIRQAKGDVIVRMDAHATYSSQYLSKLIAQLVSSGADNVGGVRVSVPGRNGIIPAAIAIAVSHPFGVGSALYQVGSGEPRWVDTVWGGCYRKEIFARIGQFDERFTRNQDDEFNHRLILNGGKILLVPEVLAYYHARSSLLKLGRTYYQYGYFKPLTALKWRRILTVRQLVPAGFLVGLLAALLIGQWIPALLWLLVGMVALYGLANVVVAMSTIRTVPWQPALCTAFVFPIIHVSYGVGYLHGMWDFWLWRRHRRMNESSVPLSR